MRSKWSKWGLIGAMVAGGLGLVGVVGCGMGEGAPDGWRYVSTGVVAVAYPKGWEGTRGGAVLRGVDGRAEAGVEVGGVGEGGVPAGARREVLEIDGSRAQVFSYARPTADGRPAGHVEVRAVDRGGRPVVVRAWAVDGTADDPSLLREIVNSIEFTPGLPR